MSINISEVIWTIICFFVLLFLLKKLLFDPLLRFIDRRQAQLDAAQDEKSRTQQALEQAHRTAEDTLRRFDEESCALLRQQKAEDDQAHLAALHKARQQAAEHLEHARTQTLQEQASADVDGHMEEWAQTLADRLSDADAFEGAQEREQV